MTLVMTKRRWPAEYEHHLGCLLLFPKSSLQTSFGCCGGCDASPTQLQRVENAQHAIMDVITAIVIHGKEDVYLFCDSYDINHQNTVITFLKERKLPFVVTFNHSLGTMMLVKIPIVSVVPKMQTLPQTSSI